MIKRVVIDRFEGSFVIVEFEGRKMVVIFVEIVFEGVKEGDVFVIFIDV